MKICLYVGDYKFFEAEATYFHFLTIKSDFVFQHLHDLKFFVIFPEIFA